MANTIKGYLVCCCQNNGLQVRHVIYMVYVDLLFLDMIQILKCVLIFLDAYNKCVDDSYLFVYFQFYYPSVCSCYLFFYSPFVFVHF